MDILGYHLLCDYVLEEGYNILDNEDFLKKLLEEACGVAGFTLFKLIFNKFQPQGLSIIAIIGESHFSIHTWPEHDFMSIDIFSCINEAGIKRAQKYIENQLHIKWKKVAYILRGFNHTKLTIKKS